MKRFPRTSMMHSADLDAAEVVQGRVWNVNLVNWTVDIVAQFDQRRYFDVQVASPYLHSNNGEGVYAMPEAGADVLVCVPSDSSPPFVMAYVMPPEFIDDSSTADAPAGTSSHGQPQKYASAASFAGGRPTANLGDIWLRTRDENFVILHRGGVLQLGATPLAQRIYIPLDNYIHDFSGNYAHYNTGGAILWGVQNGPGITHAPTQYTQTVRVYADDKFADIRMSAGKVRAPVPEPDGSDTTDAITEYNLGTDKDNPIIYEVAVAKGGFVAESGELSDPSIRNQIVMRFFFDRAGGTFLRAEGNVLIACHKKLRVMVTDDITIEGKGNMTVTVDKDITITGKQSLTLQGSVVRIGSAQKQAAGVGDMVQVILPFTPQPASPAPFIVTGTILTGDSTVLI